MDRKRLLGETHPNTVNSLHDLGFLYVLMKQYPKAETIYRQVSGRLAKSFSAPPTPTR